MSVLRQIGRFVDNMFELIAYALAGLILAAIWAVAFVIDLATDILSWVNTRLEQFLNEGTEEVDVIKGSALKEFIEQNKAQGKYPAISLSDLNALSNSVVNVAIDGKGGIVDDQMIRSNGGLSAKTNSEFRGQPVLKIKIPA